MQFIRSNALLLEARREGVVGRDDRAEAREWLKVYDEALDGRVDGGFFDFQIGGFLGMTVDHPFSLKAEKTEGLHRLLNRLFVDGVPEMASREELVPGSRAILRARQPREYSGWEIALGILLALTPLAYAGCDSSEPLDCSGCPRDLCYEGTKTLYPDAGPVDGGGDAGAPQTVTGIICGCPPDSHEATCVPDEPGGRQYPCCVSDDPIDDPY